MEIPFKVVCLDDSNRPNDIPLNKWVKKGETYTVIKVDYMNMQGRIIGFQLQEVDLSGCFPYTHFGAWRFAIPINPASLIKVESKVEEEEAVTACYGDRDKNKERDEIYPFSNYNFWPQIHLVSNTRC